MNRDVAAMAHGGDQGDADDRAHHRESMMTSGRYQLAEPMAASSEVAVAHAFFAVTSKQPVHLQHEIARDRATMALSNVVKCHKLK
jgi:hypothetical protein